ncbi:MULTISPECIES: hypothetical protein [Deefgea]|uniref:Uncharacterized protein n=1 Tax=Deefgea chitinilytica TaxID=570276 RepID=A0ABS2CFT5_9NEIS|nr:MULTISPECIES: hypothetical protein [Deefgea]MBM5573002.1 hypothetical protein [Deefgea chitinilytica]MBM9890238.1 hypothetical protein [Deefgea sp. CFH1-16]
MHILSNLATYSYLIPSPTLTHLSSELSGSSDTELSLVHQKLAIYFPRWVPYPNPILEYEQSVATDWKSVSLALPQRQ